MCQAEDANPRLLRAMAAEEKQHLHFQIMLCAKNNNKEEMGVKGGSSGVVIKSMSGQASKPFWALNYSLFHSNTNLWHRSKCKIERKFCYKILIPHNFIAI